MKRRITTVGIVILVSSVFTGVAYAQGGEPAAATVAAVLAPLAAAALGIERLFEGIWGIVETISGYIPGLEYVNKSEKEYELFANGKWKGDEIKSKIANYPFKKVHFREFKTYVSAFGSLAIGVWTADQANLMMFSSIGFENIVSSADVFVTGLVIGSGSKFTHDIIGIFSHGKGLIEEYKKFTQRRGIGNNASS